MRDEVFLLGRILFSLVFLWYGYAHLTQTEGSAQYASFKKVPNARLAVQVTGVLMALAGIAIILGIWMDLAALGVAILVVVYAFVMHRFWEESDEQAKAAERAQFMKNISIAGGALILVAVAQVDWYTLTDPVF